MKWFKHMTDMSQDVKVKRLIRKHGVEGYGLYCYILELIVRKLETESPFPDLEESSHDIASDLQMDTVKVEEVMWFCIEQGLFEQNEVTGRVCASKVYKFLQQSETRSEQIRAMITHYKSKKDCLLLSETNVKKRTEQNRIEENRKEKNSSEEKPHSRKKVLHEKTGRPMNATRYQTLCDEYGQSTVDKYIQKVADWVDSKGVVRKDYAATAAQWLDRDKIPTLTNQFSDVKIAKPLTMED